MSNKEIERSAQSSASSASSCSNHQDEEEKEEENESSRKGDATLGDKSCPEDAIEDAGLSIADPLQRRRRLVDIASTPDTTIHVVLNALQVFRYRCGAIVNNSSMQLFILSLIMINAIMMGIGTFDFVMENEKVDGIFEWIDRGFLIIFTIELGMQFVYHGWRLFADGWLLFDLVIICTSWAFANAQIIRAFRAFRAMRLITRVKVMQNLVVAVFAVVPRMLAIAVLLLLITYIFAVMFTEIFGTAYADGWTDENYFGRLDETFFTLFQMMTFDNWENICRQLMVVYPTAWLPVIAFIICTAFVIVNLIVAVICDAVSALHDDDKAKLHGRLQTDDGQTDAESESETSKHESMGSHLDALEEQVGELFRMQEETMSTLHLLTQFVADKQQRKVTSSRRRRQRDQNTSSNATEANDKD